MEEILEQVRNLAQQAEVFSVTSRKTEATFEANRLKQIQTNESIGTALRLIKDGRIGFSATTKPDGHRELIEMALEMAPFGAQAKFDLPGLKEYVPVQVFDPDVETISEEWMVDLGQSLIDVLRRVEPELVCESSVSRRTSAVQIMNSNGGMASYRKSVFSIMVEGVLVRGTDMLFVGDGESSCHPVIDINHITDSVVNQLERAKETVIAPTGELPVIFTPHGVAGALLSPLIVAFNGKTVLRGASPLGHRKGEQVLSSVFSLYDDATIHYCPAGAICDDEGIPSRPTPLIQNGVVTNFIYDLQTAGEAGTESTGNASRSVGSLPSPGMNAIVIEAGNIGFENLVAEIKEGLVVELLMGATQGNILGGDFSGNVLLGYKVENGHITGRVKNTMVSGNVFKLLQQGIVIGNDVRWLGGSIMTPSILCPSVSVAATA